MNDKQAAIMEFYKIAGQSQALIETRLDEWLNGTSADLLDEILLKTAELAIKLLQTE